MDYRKALEQAVLYIEEHLGEDISVAQVAGAAAKKLLYTDRRILDIAVENGFESAEAFSLAFKAVYKVSPPKPTAKTGWICSSAVRSGWSRSC